MCNVVPSHKCVSVLIYDYRRNKVVDFVLRVQFKNVDFARLGCYTRVYVAVRVTKVQHPTKYGVPVIRKGYGDCYVPLVLVVVH